MTTAQQFDTLSQYYKEKYRFLTTGDDTDAPARDYRIRHFLVANCPNSTVTPNSGVSVYDGNGMVAITGSYNDWTTPNRPPKFDKGGGQFNTELILRFDENRNLSQLQTNAEAWITSPYDGDNGAFSRTDVENSFSFLGYSDNSNEEYVKNPMNVVLEHKVGGGYVQKISTVYGSLPPNGSSNCDNNTNLYKRETVEVETQDAHNLRVGDAVSLYSKSVSHVPSFSGNQGRLFGKAAGERYLGDFIVTEVPNSTTFRYETYHNPMKINTGNHPEYTHDTWNDLVWEKWEMYEFAENVSCSVSGDSVAVTFTDTDPVNCKRNFVVGDNVTFVTNSSSKVHMVVSEVSGAGITAVPVEGESFPTSITSGTLKFTSRMPSSDVAFNVQTSDIAPAKVKSHVNENVLLYACQDTFYDSSQDGTASNGGEQYMNLRYDRKIPIIRFPIPLYSGEATADPDLVSKMYVYVKETGDHSDNTVYVYGYEQDFSESDNNTRLMERHESKPWAGTAINHVVFTNPTRAVKNRYIKFDIDNNYTVSMLTGNVSNSVFLNCSVLGTDVVFASRDEDEGHWPYIAISSVKFIGKAPTIDIDNTYMYLVCDSIEKGMLSHGSAYVATVNPKVFNSSSVMYVRSWDDDKPFFEIGDEIEIMNTEHYDTGKVVNVTNEGSKRVTATVVHVEYNEHKVYFRYNYWDPGDPPPEGGIIRNRSRMISTYSATDADNTPSNLKVDEPPEVHGKYGYDSGSLRFDVIHDEAADGETSLSVVYDDGNNSSNEVKPVILTDIEVIAKDGSHDREDDRFVHVGPNNTLILKGFNLDRLGPNAHAVLGHPAWEDGIMDGGISVPLLKDSAHADERYFHYQDEFNLQRSMPVYELRNSNGATQFRVRKSDYPFCGPGDVVAALYTGEYVETDNEMQLPDALLYGKNYYVVNAVAEGEEYLWLTLSSTYVFRYELITPTYVELDVDDVGYINDIIRNGGKPLVLYSTVTSLTIEDADNGVDTNYYANRLYLQLDEEAPVCYVPEPADEHIAGRAFDVYLSDLNDIYTINGQLLENFSLGTVTYLLGGDDARFIKLTLTLDSSTTLDIFDAAGNYTSIDFDVISVDSDIKIEITAISSNDTTHTLSFRVTDSDYDVLSTSTNNPGVYGIWAKLGNNYLTADHFTNISEISPVGDGGKFTFDLVITEREISQSNGYFEVWAGDTNEDDAHKTDKWGEPIIFKKTQTCVELWDVLQYRGVNLYDELEFRGPNASAFEIDDNDHNATSIPVKVVSAQNGTKSFGVKWRNATVPPALANYLNTVTVTSGPTIDIQPEENKTVKWKLNVPWTEPSPSDVVAKDWAGNDLSASVEISIDNTNWNEAGVHTITYTVKDSCDREATVQRTVIVTECDIPIIMTKDTYDTFEDIGIMIHPSSHVLFNQNFMNNIVKYRISEDEPWSTAIILSGTPDRKTLYIKNPGVIASKIFLYVDVGSDNQGANGCYTTDEVNFAIVSKEEQDKPLDVDGKASIVKKKNSVSRFDDLNFEPIYNKDLAYSSFSITADENSLMQNVYSILLTNLGERLYDDEFGSTLEESVFDIIGDLNGESKLLNQCVTLINKYEPRVVVVEDKSYVAINEDNTVVIVLYIKVPRGIARKIELTFRNDS